MTKVISHIIGVRKKQIHKKKSAKQIRKKGSERQKVWEPLVLPTAQRSFLSWRYSTHQLFFEQSVLSEKNK